MVRFTKPQLKPFDILKVFHDCSKYDEFAVLSNRFCLKKNRINDLLNGLKSNTEMI